MPSFDPILSAITGLDASAAWECQRLLAGKTKPRGNLGRLEELACRLAALTGRPVPPLPAKAVGVMAADHGVVEDGVTVRRA